MHRDNGGHSLSAKRGLQAEGVVRAAFERAGWRVDAVRHDGEPARGGDLVVRKKRLAYLVEVKAAAEARGDRLLPLWSQGWLQAVRGAGSKYRPLAVVAAPRMPPRVAQQVLDFAVEHAPGGAAGVVDFEGLQRFQGEMLEELNSVPNQMAPRQRAVAHEPADLFSDLNQWLLKVLLAPLLPADYLNAPRAAYVGARELGVAAGVSPMSAFRLVRQLRTEGYLDERSRTLQLVRRDDLLWRWQSAAASKRTREIPMRLLHRSNLQMAAERLVKGTSGGCLALFAAAEALGAGFVHGVPPHVYLPYLDSRRVAALVGMAPASPGEAPDLRLRQPSAPKSVFRGVVMRKGVPVCDLLQVWLDVASEPARGQEQADLLRRHLLQPLFAE